MAGRGAVGGDPPDATASPQASAVPAPLVTGTLLTGPLDTQSGQQTTSPEGGGLPPVPLRGDLPIGPDPLGRDMPGYSLTGVLHLSAPPTMPRGEGVLTSALDAARKKTEPRLQLDLSTTRLRMGILGSGFLLPEGTELRARPDRYGHLLLMPGLSAYRVLAPGAARAVFSERRLDVAPLGIVEVSRAGEGTKRLGYRTRRVVAQTRMGKATFELARLADAGEGGVLLCRFFVDLLAGFPGTTVCAADDVPLHVEIGWTRRGGGVVFDAVSVLRKLDLPAGVLAAPPQNATFDAAPLEPAAFGWMVPPTELTSFHGGTDEKGRSSLILANPSDSIRVVWLDGVPVAWLAGGARLELQGLPRGRYAFEMRSFLDDAGEPPRIVTLPSAVETGARDAGRL